MSSPFHIFSWQQPFLPALKQATDLWSDGRPGDAVIIVPHNRPWRYLVDIYAAAGTTGLLPKVLSLPDMVRLWRMHASPVPLRTACLLDRVALLRDCVLDLADEDHELEKRFGKLSPDAFLPWGIRLANLLEELLGQNMVTDDLPFIDEVSPPAAALLGALGRIRDAYVAALAQKGWTTPGHDFWLAARHAEDIPDLLRPADGHPVLLAGFSLLTETEDILLRSLWQAGARVCLHTDPALARHGEEERPPVHWACQEHAQWLQRWQASARPWEADAPSPVEDAQKWHYFAGYDLHSQLKALQQDLDAPSEASTAILLTHGDLLLPVLHHLPDKEVNISMGYPLDRSPLFHLLDSLFRLHEGRDKDGLFYWRYLLACLRHPYLGMLQAAAPGEEPGTGQSLRPLLRRLERRIRSGRRLVAHEDLLATLAEGEESMDAPAGEEATDGAPPAPSPERALLEELLHLLLEDFGAVSTLSGLAGALLRLSDFLTRHGQAVWERFPLDAEALYRLVRHCVPELQHNALSGEEMDSRLLHGLARQLLQQQRIPFEADPLGGVQVLGMLESRLLQFDRIFIIDATDDVLPGTPGQDPLLPDSLRRILGLPDARRRERAASHTLYRLCACAREVHFYWQESQGRSGLMDSKKARSRFVEQLIWAHEQRTGAILKPGTPPLAVATCAVAPMPPRELSLKRNQALQDAMRAFLAAPISPTALDTYLHCPLSFVWKHLCRFRPVQEVNERDDPAEVGSVLHDVLQQLYRPYRGKLVDAGTFDMAVMRAELQRQMERHDLRTQLPPDSLMMFSMAAPRRLEEYLCNQPEATILELEYPLTQVISCNGREYTFKGRLDRLDRREDGLCIVDYKTGTINSPAGALWDDEALFVHMAQVRDAGIPLEERRRLAAGAFDQLAEKLRMIQLPAYLCMLHAAGFKDLHDAALVELRDKGREYWLFGPRLDLDNGERIRQCFDVLSLLLWHMEHGPDFTGRPGEGCRWCDYQVLCHA